MKHVHIPYPGLCHLDLKESMFLMVWLQPFMNFPWGRLETSLHMALSMPENSILLLITEVKSNTTCKTHTVLYLPTVAWHGWYVYPEQTNRGVPRLGIPSWKSCAEVHLMASDGTLIFRLACLSPIYFPTSIWVQVLSRISSVIIA